MKKDVDLRACDDRLCNACFEEDEKALAALRTDKSFATTNTLTVRAAGAGRSDSPTTGIVTAGAGTSGVSGGVNVLPNVFSKDRVVSTDVRVSTTGGSSDGLLLSSVSIASSSVSDSISLSAHSATGGGVGGGVGGRSTVSAANSNPKTTTVSTKTTVASITSTSLPSSVLDNTVKSDVVFQNLVVNELLTYCCYYRDRANRDGLRKTVLCFFSSIEIANAKKVLIASFNEVVKGSQYITKRCKSSARSAHEAELEDILNLLELIDAQSGFASTCFVAVDLGRMPNYGPEDINLSTIVDRQCRTEVQLQGIDVTVLALAESLHKCDSNVAVTEICDDLVQVNQKLLTQLDSLNRLQVKLQELNDFSVKSVKSPDLAVRRSKAEAAEPEQSRAFNIVVSGLDENVQQTIWHTELMKVLNFVCGRDVGIANAFRLGTFQAGRTRPVLVRLFSEWDRRLILVNPRKLASPSTDGHQRKIFINPDEPLDVRRKQIMERIRRKAVRENKCVSVTEAGVLIINDVSVFSLECGF